MNEWANECSDGWLDKMNIMSLAMTSRVSDNICTCTIVM